MLRSFLRTLGTFAKIAGGLFIMGFPGWASGAFGGGPGVAGFMLTLLLNGWAVYAFLRYRQGRQEELVNVLAAVVASGVPLESTVRSYLKERPKRSVWGAALEFFALIFFPLYLYVRIWIGWKRYDQLVANLANRLNEGHSLSEAMRLVPGVVPRDVVLAASIGEATGTLEACLRNVQGERWSAVWLEVAPRILYPLVVLIVIMGVTMFSMMMTLPKYVRIYQEFGLKLPPVTQALRTFGYFSVDFIPLAQLALFVVISAYIALPTLRWRTPVLGKLYRWGIQAEVLRALGRLFAAGRTVPDALGFIAYSGVYPRIVRNRLVDAMLASTKGQPLEQALVNAELLPASMAPLIRSAQATNTMGWALEELGDHLAGRAVKLVRRMSLILAPMLILAIAAVVAFIAIGLFLPLVNLIEGMTEW